MVLRICCKSFLIYLVTVGKVTEMTITENFALKGPVGWSENSDLGDKEKSGRTTERRFL